MKHISMKKLFSKIGASVLAGVVTLTPVLSAGAVATQVTPSGDTVVRISNPDGQPGDPDGYIGDREVGYGWSLAERGGYLYIGGWRNTVGAVIKLYLESALVASGKMDSETVWNLVDIITNGEVPYPTQENAGILLKMNRENPGEFEIITETKEPFRHVAKYGNDLYFTTYIGGSGTTPTIYRLDENDQLTPVYSTRQGSSMRANCVYRDRLFFAGTRADEPLKPGEHCQLAVIELNEAGNGWDTVADWRDFSYETATGETGYYADDSFVSATAGSPFWDMVAYNDEIYATIPNMLGYVVFRGHPAKEGEQANEYGWVWNEVVGRDKNSPNNQGFSKTDKLGFTDASSYALGYQSVVGALGVFDGKLYAYDIDHTISAELAGIQGMLLMMTDPENPNLSAYLNPLVTTINHAQTLWRMDDTEHYAFSEVEGFTALTEGTTNEYIWKHGEYNGEFYIGTMDSKVIYNYLTRLTGGSFAEMTPAEQERQLNYVAGFVKKLIDGKLSEAEAEEAAGRLAAEQADGEMTPSKLDELKAKIAKTLRDIAAMEQWQKALFFTMQYFDQRNPEEIAAVMMSVDKLKEMADALETLNWDDDAAVDEFLNTYCGAAADLAAALESMKQSILCNSSLYKLTAEEATQLTALFDETIDAVKAIVSDNFKEEIAKTKDVVKAIKLYAEISSAVKNDVQGFDIYKTADGDNWEVVTDNGFGDKYNYGALRFVTTEEGMYITTANPFYGAQLYLLSNDKGGALLGDANGDGSVSIDDVTAIQKHLAQYAALEGVCLKAADVDGDGQVTVNDASTLQRYLAEISVPYPIGEPMHS